MASKPPRAAGLLLVHDGRVLLLKRSPEAHDAPSTWGFPGGHIEPGETPERAARREHNEETGLTHEGRLHPLGVTSDGFSVHAGRGDGQSPKLNHEHTDYQWASFDSLPKPLHPSMQEIAKMPLIEGKSDKARSENIGKEISAGKDPKQAAAIAYSVQRKAGGKAGARDSSMGEKLAMHGAAEMAEDDADAFRQNLDNLHQIANDCMAYDSKRGKGSRKR